MRSIQELIKNIKDGASAAHAYLIEGPAGETRTSFIDDICGQLGCTALDTVHMEMSGRDSYRACDAEAFSERLFMGAYGSFLAGIIDDADSLPEIVQNKLLKTLEEPQERAILLLGTSNPDHLLATVRSRCSVIRLSDYAQPADDETDGADDLRRAAALMLDKDAAFCEFRAAIEKCVRSKKDAIMLIDALEDILTERMAEGSTAAAYMAELAETARMDIHRDMDRLRALKRLYLELVEDKYNG